MEIYIDTANISDIKWALSTGVASGVTTNPSLMSKERKSKYDEHLRCLIEAVMATRPGVSVSVEVTEIEPELIVEQASKLRQVLHYDNLAIKIPVAYNGRDYLDVVHAVSRGGAVNCTACMNSVQAASAAYAGASYVSLFYNRIRDAKGDPDLEIKNTKSLISTRQSRIIAGSIRSCQDIADAGVSGADIVTVSPKVLRASLQHPKTDEAVGQFISDIRTWMKGSSDAL